MSNRWGVLCLGLLSVSACNTVKSLDEDKKVEATEEAAKPKPAEPVTTAVASATPSAPEAAASAVASAAPVPTDTPLPEGRTPVPSPEEWASVPKEVTVKGSSALNCETKMIREYLRVRCTGQNDTGGTPTGIVVKKGAAAGAITTVADGTATLIVPFVNSTDFGAVFSWTDKSHRMNARWPNGSPKPSIIATFEGAASPLDARFDRAAQDNLCKCVKELTGSLSCADSFASPNVDCYRTYQQDCPRLLACSRGERSVPPRCLPGYVNGGALNWCMKRCGPQDPCGDGERCINDGVNSVCM